MQKLYKIANIVGLDSRNTQHTMAITDAIEGVGDIDRFIEYLRRNKNGIQYETKTEKLDTLSTKYRKIIEDEVLSAGYTKGEQYARALAYKVKQCRSTVEFNNCDFINIQTDGQKFFKEHELRALEATGSRNTVIENSKLNRLAGEIYAFYVQSLKKPRQPQIEGGATYEVEYSEEEA